MGKKYITIIKSERANKEWLFKYSSKFLISNVVLPQLPTRDDDLPGGI